MKSVIQITEEPIDSVAILAEVPIAFTVQSIFDIRDENGTTLAECQIEKSYVKDFDEAPGEGPLHWSTKFDLSKWCFLTARQDGQLVGGAVIAFDTPGLEILGGDNDIAVLWDIRVHPKARGQGIGTALFKAVEHWVRNKSCRRIKVESQNNNVTACRFYMAQGLEIQSTLRGAYTEFPKEVQIIWIKDI